MTDLSTPIVEVIANKSKGVQNDTFELKITGHRNPDELVRLRQQLQASGYTIENAHGRASDCIVWQCKTSDGVLLQKHFDQIDSAIAAGGFQQVGAQETA